MLRDAAWRSTTVTISQECSRICNILRRAQLALREDICRTLGSRACHKWKVGEVYLFSFLTCIECSPFVLNYTFFFGVFGWVIHKVNVYRRGV